MATKKPAASKVTAVAVPKNAPPVPADAMERMKADVAALASKLAAPASNVITVTQSKDFVFGDEKVDEFTGIIVDFVSFNAFYEGAYNKDDVVPPNCFALGTVKNEDLVSSDSSPDPQNEAGGACKSCWANAFKSADNGKGKACKQSIKAAILCHDGELRTLKISSTGLKDFGIYVRDVTGNFGVPTYGVLTKFSFDEKFDYPSVRCSDPVPLNEEQLGLVFSKRDDALAMLMVEPDVSEFEEKVAAARNKPKGRAAGAAKLQGPATKRRAA